MVETIKMPQLGESVTEGTIERWLVKPGDTIKKYEPLAEVITDKVSAEIPSSFTGVIKEILGQEGTTYPVGTVVCTIETETDSAQEPVGSEDLQLPTEQTAQHVFKTTTEPRYSPAVLTLATKNEINLGDVTGSGVGGRVTRKDVLQYIESRRTQASSTAGATVQHEQQSIEELAFEKHMQRSNVHDLTIPVTPIRKAIAANMRRSVQEIPHAWMMMEVDVTALVQYRNRMKDAFQEREGFPITYFAFFVKAVAQAIKEYPMMNSMWAGEEILQKKDIHISIAVGTDDALYVPVIQHVDEKSIKGIAKEIYELAKLARASKLRQEHVSGGSFTVNNTGAFGSIQSAGIINYPQAAILQVESIVKKPVLIQGDMIAARHIVNICLSFDHRILDGYICGKFLGRVKNILENSKFDEMSVY